MEKKVKTVLVISIVVIGIAVLGIARFSSYTAFQKTIIKSMEIKEPIQVKILTPIIKNKTVYPGEIIWLGKINITNIGPEKIPIEIQLTKEGKIVPGELVVDEVGPNRTGFFEKPGEIVKRNRFWLAGKETKTIVLTWKVPCGYPVMENFTANLTVQRLSVPPECSIHGC